MKNDQIIKLRNDLAKVKNLNGYEVKLIIKKNLKKLAEEIEPLGEIEKELYEIVKDLNKEREELRKEFSKADGKEVMKEIEVGGELRAIYDIPPSKKEEFEKKTKELEEKYKEDIEKFEIKAQEFQTLLKEGESKFIPIKIPNSKLLQYDSEISDENMECIFDLIDEDK